MELPKPKATHNPHLALFVSPGLGHLIPMVALSKRFLFLHGFESTIFVASAEATFAATTQSELLHSLQLPSAIRVVHLSPPDISAFVTTNTSLCSRISITTRESIPALREALAAMSPQPVVLVVDVFGTWAFPVADELGIPKYVYFPMTAAFLAFTLYVPTLHEEIEGEFVDLQEPIRIPGCNPVRPEDLVDPMMDRKEDQYDYFLYMGRSLPLADAILINTWEDLEPTTLKALREDPILRGIFPRSVYPVGPIARSSGSDPPDQSRAECLAWLDEQPVESVIYISLGSGGTLSEEQLTELALGLEMSGKRFLWVVRPPAVKHGAYFTALSGVKDGLARYLPDGFLTRTQGLGLVIPMWAPQTEVLSHPSVGGFLSHCGWNSILESMVNGVPMIAWPLYAEQKMNAAMLEEQVRVAVRTKELPTKAVVGREEIEKLVRMVMDREGEGGEAAVALRRKMKQVKESGLRAVAEGESSWDSLSRVAQQWKISQEAKGKTGERKPEGEIDGTHDWS